MERSFEGIMLRGARGVFESPKLAGTLYLAAFAGVLLTSFSGRHARLAGSPDRNGRGTSPGVPGAGERTILGEFERAGLRIIERTFGPGEAIFTPGDPDDQIYFLRAGMVRTYKTYGDFKEATTALLRDGDVFGKLDLTESAGQDDFAEALTEARVAGVRKPAVAWLVKREPELALALFSALAERVRRSDEMVVSLLPREVSSRLAALLLNLAERFGEEDEASGGVLLDVRLPHRELASMIASTREAVSKAMNEFQREGLTGVGGGRRIVVLDRHALAERASGA